MDVCLDVPLPLCMREFVPSYLPRPAINSSAASKITKLIVTFGVDFKIPEAEIRQCWMLAEGLDDLVILLERPSGKHDYSVSFDQFVSESPTLAAIDEMLRFASGGTRTIRNTTVLDAYSFKPPGTGDIPTNAECFDLCQSIILLKKPKVILGCTSSIRRGHWLHQLNATGITGVPAITRVELDGTNRSSLFISSFHPSYSVNVIPWCGGTRLALIYHFILAVRCLVNNPQNPYWTSGLENIGFVGRSGRKRVDVIDDLLFSLRELHDIADGSRVLLDTLGANLEPIQYIHVFAEIHNLMWGLCTLDVSSSGRALAHIMLCWKFLFQDESSEQLFTQLLMALGKKQNYLQETRSAHTDAAMRTTVTLPARGIDRTSYMSTQAIAQLEEFEDYLRKVELSSNASAEQVRSIIAAYQTQKRRDAVSASFNFLRSAISSIRAYDTLYNDYIRKSTEIPSLLQRLLPIPPSCSAGLLDLNNNYKLNLLRDIMKKIVSSLDSIQKLRSSIQELMNAHFKAAHSTTSDMLFFFSEFDDVLKCNCNFDRQRQAELRNAVKAIFAARANLAKVGRSPRADVMDVDGGFEMVLPDVSCFVGPDLTLPDHSAGINIVVKEKRQVTVIEIL